MIPILYNSVTAPIVPDHYGIGALTDCLSCEVTEERNGAYELTMTYAANGIHAEDIAVESFIKAKPNFMDDPQLFRIYKVSKVMAGKFTVYARHISYDMSGLVIQNGSAGSCAAACVLLTASAGDFTITTDKTVSAQFSVSQPSSVRSWFGGKAGSLLDVYGGEWQYDNFTATLKQARGADRHVTIRYGKNLTTLTQEINTSNLLTGVIPFYVDQNENVTVGATVTTGLILDRDKVAAIDFTQEVDPESATPILTQLANLANAYITNNNLTIPTNSITLDFVQMQDITERVDLCDTVRIYYEALGVEATAKCIKVTWDVLQERYSKTTFGDARTNIADTIAAQSKELINTPTRAEMNRATELITGNRGGYVILRDSDGDDQPDEILIMNTPDINTATKVWRWNNSGLGYSSNGYAGPYGTAMTSDGEIVADFIKAGVISDIQGNSTIDMTNGAAKMKNFRAVDSLELIDDSDIVRGVIKYNTIDGASFEALNSSGTRVAILQQSSSGGGLYLRNNNDKIVATVQSNLSSRGFFKVANEDGDNAVEVYATAAGGVIQAFKGANAAAIITTNSSGGDLEIKNNSGNTVAYIQANTAQGASLGVYDAANNINILCSGDTGNIRCVSLTQTSSRKVKDNIKPMKDSAKILELEAVSFDFKDKEQGTDRRGFIAEDVEKVLPNLVKPETETEPAALDYVGMIPYLQDIIKKQEARITALEEKIKSLEG